MTKIHTPEWVKDAVFYQIFPDRFAKSDKINRDGLKLEDWEHAPTIFGFKGGDLYGIAEHLDYLQSLGITGLYLNPIFASASNHRYHTFDYFNVDPLLGGNEALRHLLYEAHQRDIRIVLDGVFNHASRGFWQFHHVLENGAGSPYVDWFHFDEAFLHGRARWGAYPSEAQENDLRNGRGSLGTIGYKAWWDLPALPKFNTQTPAVREFIFSVAEYWIKFGIDGWRLDVPGEIDDDSFWQEFRTRVKNANPEAYIVGEIWHEAHRWLQGDQFDAVMNYPVTIACLNYCTGKNLNSDEAKRSGGYQNHIHPMDAGQFAAAVEDVRRWYPNPIVQVQLNLLDSHDTPRFLTCANGDKASLKLAMLFLMCYPGAPCIYYGDEIGLDGGHDPECRKSFPWDEARWDKDLLAFSKSVIALRRTHPALRRGTYNRLYAEEGVYVFARYYQDETVIIALNAGETDEEIKFSTSAISLPDETLTPLMGSTQARVQGGIGRLSIPARSGAAWMYKED
jgi:neopullulanase